MGTQSLIRTPANTDTTTFVNKPSNSRHDSRQGMIKAMIDSRAVTHDRNDKHLCYSSNFELGDDYDVDGEIDGEVVPSYDSNRAARDILHYAH